jgi:soluble lytic murein transglycosylase-like protein
MMLREAVAVSLLLVVGLPAAADITQYQGADGRQYFTNLPPTHRHMLQGRSAQRFMTQPQGHTARLPTLQLIHELARQYNIEPRLVQAIITVESNFNPYAISRAGAQGLMQLMPGTAARYQVANPFDPRANIEGGIRYLKDLIHLFPGDLRHALAAYNAGEQAVQRYGGMPPYAETQQYVARVLRLYGVQAWERKIYRYRTEGGSILFTDTPR